MITLFAKFYFILALMVFNLQIFVKPLQETFEKEVTLKSGQAVLLDFKFADEIKVRSWNKTTLYVKATVEHNFKEKLDFKMLEQNNTDQVQLEEKIKNLEERKNINIHKNDSSRDCVSLDINYEVFLPANTVLNINSISGNIEIKNMDNALNIETISGFVDVSINQKSEYDFTCSTISGAIYSDISFENNENVKEDIVGTKLKTKLNGGGKKLNLKTISGDLFLRKQ